MLQTIPLKITTKRTARTAEPSAKSGGTGSDFLMVANAKHELMFHGTIEDDSLTQDLPTVVHRSKCSARCS